MNNKLNIELVDRDHTLLKSRIFPRAIKINGEALDRIKLKKRREVINETKIYEDAIKRKDAYTEKIKNTSSEIMKEVYKKRIKALEDDIRISYDSISRVLSEDKYKKRAFKIDSKPIKIRGKAMGILYGLRDHISRFIATKGSISAALAGNAGYVNKEQNENNNAYADEKINVADPNVEEKAKEEVDKGVSYYANILNNTDNGAAEENNVVDDMDDNSINFDQVNSDLDNALNNFDNYNESPEISPDNNVEDSSLSDVDSVVVDSVEDNTTTNSVEENQEVVDLSSESMNNSISENEISKDENVVEEKEEQIEDNFKLPEVNTLNNVQNITSEDFKAMYDNFISDNKVENNSVNYEYNKDAEADYMKNEIGAAIDRYEEKNNIEVEKESKIMAEIDKRYAEMIPESAVLNEEQVNRIKDSLRHQIEEEERVEQQKIELERAREKEMQARQKLEESSNELAQAALRSIEENIRKTTQTADEYNQQYDQISKETDALYNEKEVIISRQRELTKAFSNDTELDQMLAEDNNVIEEEMSMGNR